MASICIHSDSIAYDINRSIVRHLFVCRVQVHNSRLSIQLFVEFIYFVTVCCFARTRRTDYQLSIKWIFHFQIILERQHLARFVFIRNPRIGLNATMSRCQLECHRNFIATVMSQFNSSIIPLER